MEKTIMANDPNNVAVYDNADIYIAPLGSTIPADVSTAFNGSWALAGIVDGDAGMALAHSADKTNYHMWSGLLGKVSRKNELVQFKFTLVEDNATTRAIIWPGSGAGVISKRVPANIMLGFETREGGKIKRYITTQYAQVDVDGDIAMGNSDPTKYPLVATIFPNASGEYFKEQSKPAISSIAITPLTLALSLAGKIIGKLVATATYSDASTADVSDAVLWNSATPAKATVASGGWVTGVATGTSNITCTMGGVTSAAPSVVTVGA
jgi:uncharacterized protein YjdB